MAARFRFSTTAVGVAALFGALAVVANALGVGGYKVLEPFGFGAAAALIVAATAVGAPVLARWLVVSLGFIEALWLGGYARQLTFEITTLGHLTAAVDSCKAVNLLIIALPAIVCALLVAVPMALLSRFGVRNGAWTLNASATPLQPWLVLVCLAILLGVGFGVDTWSDWQVDHRYCF